MVEFIFSERYVRSPTECKKKQEGIKHLQNGEKLCKSHGGKPEKGCGLEPVKG